MKILLSPAKKLDFDKKGSELKSTQPIFLSESDKIASKLKKLSAKQIGTMMKLSPALSALNFERNQMFGDKKNERNQAIFVFNGEVYSGLDSTSWTSEDLKEANNKLRILSGLYGILKPSDVIEPYRLEMGTKIKIGKSNNLYEFWGSKILSALKEEESELIVNLASNEYNKAAKLKDFTGTVITPNFKEFKNGDYKTIMVFAKKARGMMAKWIIQNKIEKIEDLKGFGIDGYLFNEELSTEFDWVFTR